MDNQQNEAPSIKQQLVEILRGAESVVITTKENPNKDEIAAAIGLHLLLEKVEKVAEVVITSDVPKQLEFLPSDFINKQLQGQRDFVVELDQSRTEADHLKYVTETGKLKIYITPYNGSFSENDVAFSYGDYHCEAIVGLGVQDLNSLNNSVIQEQKLIKDAKFLLVNPGQANPVEGNVVNWSDTNASSVCEMIMSMSEALGSGMLDEEISTALLTGIVDKTQHFTNQATTPKVMTMAAQLLAAGARQAEIVKQLSQPDKPPEPAKKPEEKPAAPTEQDKSKQQEAAEKEEATKKRAPNELQIRQPKHKQHDSSSEGDKQSSQEMSVRDQSSDDNAQKDKQTQASTQAKPSEPQTSSSGSSNQASAGAKNESTGSSGSQPQPQPSPAPASTSQNSPQQPSRPPQNAPQQPRQNNTQKPPQPQGASNAPKPSEAINPSGAAAKPPQGSQASTQNTPPQPSKQTAQTQQQPQPKPQQQPPQASTPPPAVPGQQSPKQTSGQAASSSGKTNSNDNERVVQPPQSNEDKNPLSHDELLASLEDNGVKANPPAQNQSPQQQQPVQQSPNQPKQPQQSPQQPQQNPQQGGQTGAGGRINLDEARKAVEEAQKAQNQDDSSAQNQ